MKISGIYKIINKTNRKYYIGSSKDIKYRWHKHKYSLNNQSHSNSHLQRAWVKYGSNNFDWIIIEKIPIENLLTVEQRYLNIAKSEKSKCYNSSFIAGKIEMTEEIKKKISLSLYGNKRRFGLSHTADTKTKISNSLKGKPKSEEWKIQTSKRLRGIAPKISNEARKRAGEKLRGRKRPAEMVKRMKISKIGTKRKYLPNGSFIMIRSLT